MADFELTDTPLLSRTAFDRAEELRSDSEALQRGWAQASVLWVNRRGQARITDDSLVLDPTTDVADRPPEDAVFLGIYEDRHVWALRTVELDGELADLRLGGAALDDAGAGLFTTAVALLNWHSKAQFSAVDGSRTRAANAGWSRISEEREHEEFPRTDPAVICLVHDGGDRALLARQHAWPATMFSILAGFVEAGESLERCVEREIKEEVGLDITDARYLGSQPWPFPRSVMIGFSAVADPDQELVFSDGEIAEAHWFSRQEVREALEIGDWASKSGARLLLPGSISIARGIVSAWAAAG